MSTCTVGRIPDTFGFAPVVLFFLPWHGVVQHEHISTIRNAFGWARSWRGTSLILRTFILIHASTLFSREHAFRTLQQRAKSLNQELSANLTAFNGVAGKKIRILFTLQFFFCDYTPDLLIFHFSKRLCVVKKRRQRCVCYFRGSPRLVPCGRPSEIAIRQALLVYSANNIRLRCIRPVGSAIPRRPDFRPFVLLGAFVEVALLPCFLTTTCYFAGIFPLRRHLFFLFVITTGGTSFSHQSYFVTLLLLTSHSFPHP